MERGSIKVNGGDDEIGKVVDNSTILSLADQEFYEACNETEQRYDERQTVVSLFRKQAARTPEKVAVVFKERQLTYRELDQLTDRLAAYIHGLGIGREDVVSILILRSEYMPITALGVSKAGAAYQPLDPSYPVERLQFMMQDANAKLLIADEEMLSLLGEYDVPVLLTREISALPVVTVPAGPQPQDLFILLYTSGSTGVPKGCMLEQRNLVAFCHYYIPRFELDASCAVAAYASFGFDANMMDMYPALLCGATLHIIPEEMRLELEKINDYFNRNQITHAFMTTQVGRQFVNDIQDNHSLRHIMVGGETLVPIAPPKGYRLFNAYGPTECTVFSTVFAVDALYDNVPIGKVVDNMKFYILDKTGQRVPVGEEGELYLAGPQVARGYLGRPEKTQEVFQVNPFCSHEAYSRMYYTGDVVRLLPDGNLEFVGRRDSQVKVRGFRIELTEIEQVIREFPNIGDATVIAKNSPAGGQMVLAYIVSDQKIDISALNAFIAEKKPPYMVPAATMQIDKIPLNPNMKVDKAKLPEISFAVEDTSARGFTRLEIELLEMAGETLGIGAFMVDTPLIMAGLTSLSAIKLAARIQKKYGFSPDVKSLLKGASIIDIENEIVEHLLRASATPVVGKTVLDRYPLTQTQLGIYLECMKEGGAAAYNIPLLSRLPQQVDIVRFKEAIQKAIACHPVFYSSVVTDEAGDVFMLPRPEFSWEIEESELGEDQMPPELTTFSFGERPLFRVRILQTEKNTYLLLEVHHIIADGESVMLLLEEINAAYEGDELEPETYTSFDLAQDEVKVRKTTALEEARSYYDSVLKGVVVDSLPAHDVFGTESYLCDWRQEVSVTEEQVSALCAQYGITENVFFTGAFGLLLAKFAGEAESLFTTIYNGRTDPRTFGMVGMLVKTLPVYVETQLAQTVKDYLVSLKEQLDEAKAHDIYSFAEISRRYDISGDILFAYQGGMLDGLRLCGHPLETVQLKLSKVMAALSVEVFKVGQHFQVLVEYDGGEYSEGFIKSFADAYAMSISSLLSAKTLGEVQLLSPTARRALQGLHDTFWKVPDRPAYRLLQDSAARYPERIAVIACGQSLTYAQLNRQANRLGRKLRQNGLAVEGIAGVMLKRNLLVYIARQGILKAGGAFLPIDPEYPVERIQYILQDSGARHLVVSREVYEARKEFLDSLNIGIFLVDEGENTVLPADNLNIDVPPEALAYCIYTSGSTGKPKGVMLTQRNLVNFVDANPKNYEILGYTEYGQVSLALAAITFDVSIMEEFIPLANGLTVCMANEEEIHNPLALRELCLAQQVDIMTCTPSFLMNLIDIPEMKSVVGQLRSIDLGAEAFPAALYGKLRALNPDIHIMNGYGPTEATISCTMAVIQGPEHITIGQPNANVKVVMVDGQNQPLPIGALGEMVIMGDCVGRGYINREELTEKSFIRIWDMPAYKSGDLARFTATGEIEFHGRTDNQVKLRGLRVELGEIEAVLNEFPGIKNSIVVMKNNASEDFLAAYFTAEYDIDTTVLTAHLSSSLTYYMVPGVLVQLESFPLTANGKIDKKGLPAVEYTAAQRAYEAPRNSVEEKLCEIFAGILNLERVGATDDFFALGGTSLSASKVAMAAMKEDYPIVYSDIFQYPTPRGLALRSINRYDEERDVPADEETESYDYSSLQGVLQPNALNRVEEIQRHSVGNLMLIGGTGFLGIHVLKQYLEQETGTVYCLLRRGHHRSSIEKRLSSLLMYYFSDAYESMMGSRIQYIDGDITDEQSLRQLEELSFDTVINCAAIVKHFTHDDSLERINVQGVRNLIALCQRQGKRLIQISTVSVGGEGKNDSPPREQLLAENQLYFGQILDNAYVHTKFMAERYMLEAIRDGMDGKIMRVGNLMSRNSDGEFQINFNTNAFMRRLRGYRALGKFPMGLMDAPAEFSPIDSTAEAILHLAGTDGAFTVFHPYNNHLIFMSDVIASMNRQGFAIRIVSDEEFAKALREAVENPELAKAAAGLIAYMEHDGDTRYEIDAANKFTIEALYRLEYLWPIISNEYLDKSISMLEQLGFFDDPV